MTDSDSKNVKKKIAEALKNAEGLEETLENEELSSLEGGGNFICFNKDCDKNKEPEKAE